MAGVAAEELGAEAHDGGVGEELFKLAGGDLGGLSGRDFRGFRSGLKFVDHGHFGAELTGEGGTVFGTCLQACVTAAQTAFEVVGRGQLTSIFNREIGEAFAGLDDSVALQSSNGTFSQTGSAAGRTNRR